MTNGDAAQSRPLWETALRVLTFRSTREELLGFGDRELAFGALLCWIVGVGRYWDAPKAEWVQRLGLGSVAYIFVLALFIWLLFLPWKIDGWSYKRVAAFISLTAPPAILYAIPVEMLFGIETASSLNVWALAIVAGWRAALLWFFFRRLGELSRGETFIATVLPISAIVAGLTWMNLASGAVVIMGGLRAPTSRDDVNGILAVLSFLFFFPFWGGAAAYLFLIWRRWKRAA